MVIPKMLCTFPADILISIAISVNDCRSLLNLIQTHPRIKEILTYNLFFIIKQMKKNNKAVFKELSIILSYCYIKNSPDKIGNSPSFESFLNICNYLYIHTVPQIKSQVSLISTGQDITEQHIGNYLYLRINKKLFHGYALSFIRFNEAKVDIVCELINKGYSYSVINKVAHIYDRNPNVLVHFDTIVGQDRTEKRAEYAIYILGNIDESHMSRYFFLADMMRKTNLYFIIRACMFTTSEFERMEMLVKTGITYDNIMMNITYDIAAFIVFTNLNQAQMHIIFKINTFDSSLIQQMIEDREIYKYRGDGHHNYHEDMSDEEEETEIASTPLPTRAVADESDNNLHSAFINTLNGLENGINADISLKYYDIWSTLENIGQFKSLVEQGFAKNIAVKIIRNDYYNEHVMYFRNKGIEPNIAFILGCARIHNHETNEHQSNLLARIFEGYIIPPDIDVSELDISFSSKISMFQYNINKLSNVLRYTPHMESILQMGHDVIAQFRELLFYTHEPFVYIFDEQIARTFSMVRKNDINIQYVFEKLNSVNKTVTIKQIETYCIIRHLGINMVIANYIMTGRQDIQNNMTWTLNHFYEIKRLISNGISPIVAQDTIAAFDKIADKRIIDMFMSCIDMFSSLGLNKIITSKDICLFVFIMTKSETFEEALDIFKNINPTIRNAITNSIKFGWSYKYALQHFKVILS
jgi:hypothetical protein